MEQKPLGIIAGAGDAPKRLIAACQRIGRPCAVLAFKGITDEDIVADNDDVPIVWIPLGAAQAAIDAGRSHNITEVVFLGRIRRPSLSEFKPDALMLKKMAKVSIALLGDDGLLRVIIKEFANYGFHVIPVQDVFTEFLMPGGQITRAGPSERNHEDIRRGKDILHALGKLDVGQSVIVQEGLVLGIEAIEGTDALIRRAGTLRREGPGGVLVKLMKPGQDKRADMPCVGIQTLKEMQSAGLAGIAIEARGALLMDREEVVRFADGYGIFITGIRPK